MASRTKLDTDLILEKATALVDAHGLDQLSLISLAQELHIKPPSLYNHVDGLQSLKQKLSLYGTEQLYAHLLPAAVGKTGDQAVHALSQAYIDFVKIHPGLYDAANRISKPLDEKLEHAQTAIVKLVLQVLQEYELQEEAAIHTVRGLRSILHGFASLERTGGFQMSVDLDESFSVTISTYLEGIHSMVEKQKNKD
ncbi:TetR/AcrR family transcriptional regulator [Salinicoccus hispanicus]|uniref:TetR family transcriptional regulator n=1 Tax=Salinicoccus hispanicus TaxID=157225 RepID=A0A6N8U712_9STAP|nr:TetR/AcrR family transcriptional regulator [Salinicoccus hispanicus]MXQ52141.1 TetR family transcriptional regulator [Salinicoccus hispanicus]